MRAVFVFAVVAVVVAMTTAEDENSEGTYQLSPRALHQLMTRGNGQGAKCDPNVRGDCMTPNVCKCHTCGVGCKFYCC